MILTIPEFEIDGWMAKKISNVDFAPNVGSRSHFEEKKIESK